MTQNFPENKGREKNCVTFNKLRYVGLEILYVNANKQPFRSLTRNLIFVVFQKGFKFASHLVEFIREPWYTVTTGFPY